MKQTRKKRGGLHRTSSLTLWSMLLGKIILATQSSSNAAPCLHWMRYGYCNTCQIFTVFVISIQYHWFFLGLSSLLNCFPSYFGIPRCWMIWGWDLVAHPSLLPSPFLWFLSPKTGKNLTLNSLVTVSPSWSLQCQTNRVKRKKIQNRMYRHPL